MADNAKTVTQLKSREQALTEGIAHLTHDLNKCKSDLLNTERMMFDQGQRDKMEIKALD